MNSFQIDKIDPDARRVLDAADILLTGKYIIKTVTVIECADEVTASVLRDALGAHVVDAQLAAAKTNYVSGDLKTCAICGEQFSPVRATQTICANPECKRERQRRFNAESTQRRKTGQPAGEPPLS